MKNKKSAGLNKGFRNSLLLGIFLIATIVGFVFMVGINIHRAIKDSEAKTEKMQQENKDKDTVWVTLPAKEVVVRDTIWRTAPQAKPRPVEKIQETDTL